MDMAHFENEWKELSLARVSGKVTVTTSLRNMLVRSRGFCTVDGCKAVNFEAKNEDVDPMILRVFEDAGGSTYCLRWDDLTEKWENIGKVMMANEWSSDQLKRVWEACAIQTRIKGELRVLKFKDIFSSCLGEKYDGLVFVGKGRFDGSNLLIRLNRDRVLDNYYDDQECDIYNEDKDEWEFWGLLVKHVPMK